MTARDLHEILARYRFAPPVEMIDLEQLRDSLRAVVPAELSIDIVLDEPRREVRVQVGKVYSFLPIG